MKNILAYDPNNTAQASFRICIFTCLYFLIFALVSNNPIKSIQGLLPLWVKDSGLITDYIALSNISIAFLNLAIVMIMELILLKKYEHDFHGAEISCFYIVGGYALFGQNLLNMSPILIGNYLYAKYTDELDKNNLLTGLMATCASPIVNYHFKYGLFKPAVNIFIGFILGIITGFLITAIAKKTPLMHENYSVYNTGFAAGLVLVLMASFIRAFGLEFNSNLSWYDQDIKLLTLLLLGLFLIHFLIGFSLNNYSLKGLSNFIKGRHDELPDDYVQKEGLALTLMNMSLLGIEGLLLIICLGASFSGPVIAGILTLCGFGAMGKNYYAVIWLWLGIILFSFVAGFSLNEPTVTLAFFFVGALSPIYTRFGAIAAIIAGILHVAVVRESAGLCGYLNLYNNGFAAGIVASVYTPILKLFRNRN